MFLNWEGTAYFIWCSFYWNVSLVNHLSIQKSCSEMWALCHICVLPTWHVNLIHLPMNLVTHALFEKSIKSDPNWGSGPKSLSSVADLPFSFKLCPILSSHLIKMKFITVLAFTAVSVLTMTLAAHLSIKMHNGPVKPDSYIVYAVWLIDHSIGIILSCCFV